MESSPSQFEYDSTTDSSARTSDERHLGRYLGHYLGLTFWVVVRHMQVKFLRFFKEGHSRLLEMNALS